MQALRKSFVSLSHFTSTSSDGSKHLRVFGSVVSTDVTDPDHQGKLQNTPATENNASCEQPCNTDAHCGGGCLCGVKHIRRCAGDADIVINACVIT